MNVKTRLSLIIILIFLLAMLAMPLKASAHGAHIQYTSSGIEITAKYDTGEPMSGAQISIYAPDDVSNAWLTGTLDITGVGAAYRSHYLEHLMLQYVRFHPGEVSLYKERRDKGLKGFIGKRANESTVKT